MTFSEERLRQILAEFKLELVAEFAKKASQEGLDILDHRVRVLELWQAAMVATEGTKERLNARSLVLWGLGITLFVGLLTAIVTLVWLAVGG